MNLFLSRDTNGTYRLWYLPQPPTNAGRRLYHDVTGQSQPAWISEDGDESFLGIEIAPGECVLLDVNIAVETKR